MPSSFKAHCSLRGIFAHMTQSAVKSHNGPAHPVENVGRAGPWTPPRAPPASRPPPGGVAWARGGVLPQSPHDGGPPPQGPPPPPPRGGGGLPLNPSRSAPGMSSTPSAQSHIRGYRSGGPQSSPSAGLPKSDYAHAAAAARPAKAGVSPKAARLAGTGAMSIPRPPGTSCRGPRATSRARPRWPRWPSPRACRGRASPRAAAGAARTPSSRASLSRGARPCPSA